MADIKDKVKKLLALATSPNENEAKAALLKAKSLMAKYKLTEAECVRKDQKLVSFLYEDISWTTDSGQAWMSNLCGMLCNEYLCVAAWRTKPKSRTHVLHITGMEDDLDVCKSIIEYTIGFIRGAIAELQRKYPRQNAKTIANSYAEGFICGLEIAFEMQKAEHPEWGLVVVKPSEVKQYEDSLSVKSITVNQKASFDPLAYLRGQSDGQNFDSRRVLPEHC